VSDEGKTMSPDHLSNPSDHRIHIRPLTQRTSAGRFLSQRHNTMNCPCISNWYLLRIARRRRLPLSKLRGLNRPERYPETHPEPNSTETILWALVNPSFSYESYSSRGLLGISATFYFPRSPGNILYILFRRDPVELS
jgi:hypothetical protein